MTRVRFFDGATGAERYPDPDPAPATAAVDADPAPMTPDAADWTAALAAVETLQATAAALADRLAALDPDGEDEDVRRAWLVVGRVVSLADTARTDLRTARALTAYALTEGAYRGR